MATKKQKKTEGQRIRGSIGEQIRENALLIPVMFVLAVIPLILRYHSYDSRMNVFSWYADSGEKQDYFLYYKSIWFIIVSVIMLAVFLWYQVRERGQRKNLSLKFLVPLGVYAGLTLLSTVCSKYRYFSIHGMSDHFESVFVHLGYCIALLYGAYFLRKEKQLRMLVDVWNVGILLFLLMGVLQLAGVDIMNSKVMTWLIFPSRFWPKAGTLLHNVFEKGRVFASLYNPNYVGSYAALVLPVLLAVCVAAKAKWKKVLFLVEAALLFLCLLGSGSRNGLLALGLVLVLMAVFYRGSRMEWKRTCIGLALGVLVFGGIFLAYNHLQDNQVTDRLGSGLTIEKTVAGDALETIETLDDSVKIIYNGNELKAECIPDENGQFKLQFTDEKGNLLVLKEKEEGVLVLDDERFPFEIFQATANNIYHFIIRIDGKDWIFSNQTGYQGYFLRNAYGKYTKIENAESVLFTDYSHVFSGRGYIWGRTIPLLRDTILIGSGPDTFATRFPQRDYIEAERVGITSIVSKPHNMYLQIGVQNGVAALLAFLTIYALYGVWCLKLYWKNARRSYLSTMGTGFFLGTLGYMLVGIANDSMVVVSPVFWTMLGIGLAINGLVQKEKC